MFRCLIQKHLSKLIFLLKKVLQKRILMLRVTNILGVTIFYFKINFFLFIEYVSYFIVVDKD